MEMGGLDENHTAAGQAAIKSSAMVSAERAIDRQLASNKLRLVPTDER